MRKGIQKIFSEVVETYEIVNHILTFGCDIFWRRKAAKEASKAGGNHWLDVCSGTGEMALSLSRWAGKEVKIISLDFCLPMLRKAIEKKDPHISFIIADASRLPFHKEVFNCITLSFATRNININKRILEAHLGEFYRILKPGGHFINLETSQPPLGIIQRLFHLYIKIIVRPLGILISGSKAGYSYLAFTIPRFYSPDEFSSILFKAGFTLVTHRSLLLGVSAIHTAIK